MPEWSEAGPGPAAGDEAGGVSYPIAFSMRLCPTQCSFDDIL